MILVSAFLPLTLVIADDKKVKRPVTEAADDDTRCSRVLSDHQEDQSCFEPVAESCIWDTAFFMPAL